MEKILSYLYNINYWENVPAFKKGFIRKAYLDSIKQSFGNTLIKVLVGQRRTGKSYIVRQLIDFLINEENINPKNIFYLNKELYEFDSLEKASDLADLISLYEKELKIEGKVYIFIDEIQNITDWEKIVVSLAQHSVKSYELIITGSNSGLLSGELATKIAGRYIVFEIFPFSYSEFLEFYNLRNSKQNFINYFETSGLPEIYNIPSDEIRKNYFRSLKDTILLKDIMYRHKIRDYVLLEDIFLFLIHNVGNLTSVSSIIKYFKSKRRNADFTTITSYISYMEDAFIIQQSQRFYLKTKELLSGERKYYINDIGFRNYLFPRLKSDIASILENIVFIHLRRAKYTVFTGNDKNLEIDFVAEKNGTFLYVQVCYLLASQSTIDREFGVLENIKDNFHKYVISMDDILIENPKGIKHQNIWNFIKILQ